MPTQNSFTNNIMLTMAWWNTEIIFFQPNQTNDRPEEPHGSADKRSSVPKKWGWFWASVEVHIQNSENDSYGYLSLNNRAFRYLKNMYANAYLRRCKRFLNGWKLVQIGRNTFDLHWFRGNDVRLNVSNPGCHHFDTSLSFDRWLHSFYIFGLYFAFI